jgi:2-amino-4-hydroxy-6-hydroxymethyldihydropteridine diphosphokinase
VGRQSYLIALGGNRATSRATLMQMLELSQPKFRHAELVSASTPQLAKASRVAGWTLKQVQGDGIRLLAASSVHTTAPLGPGKRSYANAVALIETDLDPLALLAHLKAIERAHGRRAGRRWGDRPLDLDIIGWSGGIWASRTLSIPHAAFRTRRFVLAPLVEIAPDWRDPVTNLTARQLLARLDRSRPRS